MTTIQVNWGDSIVRLIWEKQSELPPRDLITSAHGYCFYQDKLMLVNLRERGWDFPGGHMNSMKHQKCVFKGKQWRRGMWKEIAACSDP